MGPRLMKAATLTHIVLVGLAFAVLLGSTTDAAAAEIPSKFHGLWTDSALTCDAHKRNHKIGPDQTWIRVSRDRISGSTNAQISRIVNANTLEYFDRIDTPSWLTLRKDGFLEDQIDGARDSMVYMRCK